MSIEPETIPPMLIDKEKAFEMLVNLWRTLGDMNRASNDFMIAMEKAGPLNSAQADAVQRWNRAMKNSQEQTLAQVQSAEIRPHRAMLN